MAAEEIKGILHGREKPEQERIVRWVMESIGISISITTSGTPSHQAPPPLAALAAGHVPSHSSSVSRKDIKSFVAEKQPKSDVQFAAVAAYFYRFEVAEPDRKEWIVSQDLQNAGRQARGFGFKDPTVTLRNAVTLGYFDRAGRGEFKLNAVGENLVAMALPGTDSNGKKLARPRPKKPKRSRNARPKNQNAA